jgi:hypothetical protein
MSNIIDESGPNPGFELLCTVEADLRRPFHAAPVQSDKQRNKFKEVQVRKTLYTLMK